MKKYYVESRREWSVLHTTKGRNANWIGHILCRNCLPENVIEGKIDVTEDYEEDVSSY
jgi:hypothetical protein